MAEQVWSPPVRTAAEEYPRPRMAEQVLSPPIRTAVEEHPCPRTISRPPDQTFNPDIALAMALQRYPPNQTTNPTIRYGVNGRTKPYYCTLKATPIIPSGGLDTPSGKVYPMGDEKPLILRDQPVQLPNGSYTTIKYINGCFARGVMFFLLYGCMFLVGPLCLLALYPMCSSFGVKWMKDVLHTNPQDGSIIGIYYRGFQDAPSVYQYKNAQQEIVEIVFGSQPVILPDEHTTITRRRLGGRNFKYMMYLSIILSFLLLVYFFIGSPVIILFCLLPPCLRDTEHVHPVTGEVVGVHYHCVMEITRSIQTGPNGGTAYKVDFIEPH